MRTLLTRDFFKLEGNCPDLDQVQFMSLAQSTTKICENRIYRPDKLDSPYPSGRLRVKGITFRNVSFGRTQINGIEFTECRFERCLFLSTTFRNCRFTACIFTDCNPYRVEFDGCYVDPISFERCIFDRRYSNIGIYLFQELLRNSRQQAQPDFSDEAQYLFRRWQRYQLQEELKSNRATPSKRSVRLRLAGLHIFEIISGSGVRITKLIRFVASIIILFTAINWFFANCLGLNKPGSDLGLVDAFYFATVTATTVGFGDITPSNTLGRIVVSIEAIIGFILFALVTSTLYRKFSS